MPYISKTPKPPYYTVVFTAINADVDHTEHVEMFGHLAQRAATYDGYLGIEAARNSDGTGVAAVYWKDLASIEAWARDPEHQVAKRKSREISAKSSALMADPTARRIGSVESTLIGGHV